MTGPSLTSATCISAPNRPVATVAPSRRSSATSAVDDRFGVLGPGGRDPARAATLGGVAVERELADDEDLGADVGGGPVHHSRLVVEQAKVAQAVGELPGDGLVVVVGDADEHAQPAADPADLRARPRVTAASVTRCTTRTRMRTLACSSLARNRCLTVDRYTVAR